MRLRAYPEIGRRIKLSQRMEPSEWLIRRRLAPELRPDRWIKRSEALALAGEKVGKLRVGLGDISDFGRKADSFGRLARRGDAREARGAVCRACFAALHAHYGKAGRGCDHPRP